MLAQNYRGQPVRTTRYAWWGEWFLGVRCWQVWAPSYVRSCCSLSPQGHGASATLPPVSQTISSFSRLS